MHAPVSSNVSMQKLKIITITISLLFGSHVYSKEFLLFSENLDNILEIDGFNTCTEHEQNTFKLSPEECATKRNAANSYCSNLVKALKPNKLTHEEWEHRMSYFYHCRITLFADCQYSFEQTDLINKSKFIKDPDKLAALSKKYEELLICNTE